MVRFSCSIEQQKQIYSCEANSLGGTNCLQTLVNKLLTW